MTDTIPAPPKTAYTPPSPVERLAAGGTLPKPATAEDWRRVRALAGLPATIDPAQGVS